MLRGAPQPGLGFFCNAGLTQIFGYEATNELSCQIRSALFIKVLRIGRPMGQVGAHGDIDRYGADFLGMDEWSE